MNREDFDKIAERLTREDATRVYVKFIVGPAASTEEYHALHSDYHKKQGVNVNPYRSNKPEELKIYAVQVYHTKDERALYKFLEISTLGIPYKL